MIGTRFIIKRKHGMNEKPATLVQVFENPYVYLFFMKNYVAISNS